MIMSNKILITFFEIYLYLGTQLLKLTICTFSNQPTLSEIFNPQQYHLNANIVL